MNKNDKMDYKEVLKENGFEEDFVIFGKIVKFSTNRLRALYKSDKPRFMFMLKVAVLRWKSITSKPPKFDDYKSEEAKEYIKELEWVSKRKLSL